MAEKKKTKRPNPKILGTGAAGRTGMTLAQRRKQMEAMLSNGSTKKRKSR